MNEFRIDIDAWLERVGLRAAPAVGEEGLRELQRAQFFSVPFENLDIQLGREIALEPEALFAKLVTGRRGGYCFELNGLLLLVLKSLGYSARPVLARVHLSETPSGFTHQISAVELGGRVWLVDSGFGAGGPRMPMPLEEGLVQEIGTWAARLVRSEPWGWMMQTRIDGEWLDGYSFDLRHVTRQDIAVGNFYTSHSPLSHFTTTRIAGLPTPDGRVSVANFTLTRIAGSQKNTREIEPGEPYLETLRQCFGIELGADYDDLRPIDS